MTPKDTPSKIHNRVGKRRLALAVGDLVEVELDSGERSLRMVGSRPWTLGGTLVVSLNGIAGGYALSRCHPIARPRRLETSEGRAEVGWLKRDVCGFALTRSWVNAKDASSRSPRRGRPRPVAKHTPTFETYRDETGSHRWRLKGGNGEVIASGEPYPTAAHVRRAIAKLREIVPTAELIDVAAEATPAPAPSAVAPAPKRSRAPKPA